MDATLEGDTLLLEIVFFPTTLTGNVAVGKVFVLTPDRKAIIQGEIIIYKINEKHF